MARKQTKNIAEVENSENIISVKPEPQVIVAHGIARLFDKDDFEMIEQGLIKKFNVNLDEPKTSKIFVVFEDGLQIAEVYEDDERIEQYLNYNKDQLESWINNLKQNVTDANVLLFFNVGKQNRSYMTYEAYFSQNGLAPKPCLIKNWMDYHLSIDPTLSEEEVALKTYGNLKYSFSIRQN